MNQCFRLLKTHLVLLAVLFLMAKAAHSINPSSEPPTPQEDEAVKTGWTFGALPALSYNSDLGFQYGALVNLYYFGDGTTYPRYMHSLYAEVSRYTKGSGVNRLFYDSEYLIPNIRITSDLSFLTEKALDFYGFNGYDSPYISAYEDESDPLHISRMFYRHEREMFRFTTDFQGSITGREFRWIAGFGILHNRVAPVNIDALNEGKDPEDMLPDEPGLYDKYVEWGFIGENERDGGWNNHLKLGLVYDTRDFEPHPMKGMWTELVLFAAPKFLGNGDFGYSKISATHRQYFTLVEDKLSFAYRLNYQGTISGQVPFYMQPYMISSFSASSNTDGLGGSKTLRGVLRNRVVGDGVAFGNAELRWKFYQIMLLNQEIYLALNAFVDAGKVVQKMHLPDFNVIGPSSQWNPDWPDVPVQLAPTDEESLHTAVGAGLKVVMNKNFIVSVDYGKALDERDGGSGLYIGLNFLF
jgi:outer membrane protein assembly factor BamA